MHRELGMLYGLAIGDALGVPHEFTYGRIPYSDTVKSPVSDDTEMMMALLGTLVECGGEYKKDKVIVSYCRWASSGVPDIGINTANLFMHPSKIPEKILAYYRTNYDSSPHTSQANGCLMRAAPLALLPKSLKIWREDCALSNPHPVCMEASDIYFRMLHALLTSTNDPLSIDWATLPENREAIKQALHYKTEIRDVSKQRGWVCHALYFACIMYAHTFESFEEGMRL